MQKVRIFAFSLTAILIGAGAFSLSAYQETGETRNIAHPTAYVESANMNVSFKMGGRVEEILVKEGDRVKKGQVLARLESKELQSKVAQARAVVQAAMAKQEQGTHAISITNQTADEQIAQASAALKMAQARLDALKNGARQEDYKKAQIQLQAAKKAYQIAETNLERTQELFKQGAVPQVKVDEMTLNDQKAQAEYEVAVQQMEMVKNGARPEEVRAAQAQVDQAIAALALAEAGKGQVQLRQDDVKAADASIAQAQAALQEAETYLQYTELKAPVDGVIASMSAQIGELVGSGFPVFTLEAEGEHWAYFYFPETEIGQYQVGQSVKLESIASGEKVEGKISVLKPAADFAIQKATQDMGDTDIRSFGIKVSIPLLPDQLHPGMTVQLMGKGAGKQ